MALPQPRPPPATMSSSLINAGEAPLLSIFGGKITTLSSPRESGLWRCSRGICRPRAAQPAGPGREPLPGGAFRCRDLLRYRIALANATLSWRKKRLDAWRAPMGRGRRKFEWREISCRPRQDFRGRPQPAEVRYPLCGPNGRAARRTFCGDAANLVYDFQWIRLPNSSTL